MVIGWCFFFNGIDVHADPGSPVQVQLQVPKINKTPVNSSIINVDLKPKQSVQFVLHLQNTTPQAVQLKVYGGVAQTNSAGNIDISTSQHLRMDDSWRYSLADLGFQTQILTLAPQQEQLVPVTLTAPSSYRGSISGSAIVETLSQKQYHHQINNFQMSFGVLVNVGKYTKLKPHVRLGKVRLQSLGGRPQIVGNVHNQSALYYGNNAVKYQMSLQGLSFTNRNVHQHFNLSQGALAANSIAPLAFDLGNDPIKAGQYRYRVLVDLGDKVFHLQKTFSVTRAQAQRLNRQNPDLKHDYRPLIVVIIILVVLLFGLILWLVFRFALNKGRRS
ncbi:DUF916 and DUF3324 domain-containing protein [Bombilactobacillus folatiphilus]|uniref:DUF916 and DUF3324 domain-containing protein n=1 Tax=Bombilactobacillus folatiphilus TaxID=2923362 RepID=A0ABY4P812_9LACO|nr:DUF3324 domain-containing protein [Bombilactobacillus folatiphilus]UQS81853.1 DUF916 and DUF3324 domain-containing protein [Bombilactobacillus folatiphilus]